MATPLFEQGLTLEDVLELSAHELREELAGRDIDAKGISKVEMQKAFINILFPIVLVAPVVTQPVSPRTAVSPQQLMELEVMKLKIEAEERKDLRERELRTQEQERQEKAEALEKRERREEQDRQALEKKEAIEREEKAEALRKQEK